MGVNDYGAAASPLDAPPLGGPGGWAESVAAVLDGSDETVDSRIAVATADLGARITRPNVDDRLVEQWNGTAWSVVDYDSGWRSLVATSGGVVESGSFGSSDWGPHPTSTGGVRIRRVNRTVYATMLWVECKVSNAQGAIVILPSGFGADVLANPTPVVPAMFGSGLTNVLLATSPNLYKQSGVTTAGESFGRYGSVVVSYPVGDTIPTSLPGVLVTPAPQ